MRHTLVLAALAALFLGGCTGSRPEPSGKTGTVTLEVNEGTSVSLDPLSGSLAFVRKESESRCPTGVQCVRAGEASILVTLAPPSHGPVSFTLTTSPAAAMDRSVDTLGYRLTLQELTPYPDAEHPQPSTPSVATIRVLRQ